MGMGEDMSARKKKIRHTWEDCTVISKAELIEALSDWCEIHESEPVTARGLDKMLGIERARR
jgi:hypothetical protein